ncbi:MAG: UDP-2,3-diacylglucosamine diphosphatase LpxI [Puniceicoccales bacterium]|jgi:DUF1009 family protein|nr:UDP-2,3-diacylglucosamine diphosphatase LpxI [Puniceicoccales bacterium]
MVHDSTIVPAESRIAVIAGRGDYPILCSRNIAAVGHEPVVIAVDDGVNAEWLASFSEGRAVKISVGQMAKFLRVLKNFGVKFAVMAGQVKPKKLFRGMIPDAKALLMLAALKEYNAESIFGAIANEIAKIGVQLLDARWFMEDELATVGPMTCKRSKISEENLKFGVRVAREVANLNIGQSVVVRRGTVIAVEDFAGTDELIARVGKFNLRDAIFVKTAKHSQDFRFDVPVFGMQTLEKLAAANIKYAALEAESVIILHKKDVLAFARERAIEIVGF